MEGCIGIGDWTRCPGCSLLCSSMCPIESDNVMEELKKNFSLEMQTSN